MGGFDLDAAEAIAGNKELHRHQVLDLLTLIIDKSLVVAENAGGGTRYRLMETVRQYALEKLASPVRPTMSATATATTTQPWRRCWTNRPQWDTNCGSSRPKPDR